MSRAFGFHEAGGSAIASPLPSFSGTGWTAGSTGTGTLTFAAGSGDDPTRTLTLLVPNIDAIAKSHEVKFTFAAVRRRALGDPLFAAEQRGSDHRR